MEESGRKSKVRKPLTVIMKNNELKDRHGFIVERIKVTEEVMAYLNSSGRGSGCTGSEKPESSSVGNDAQIDQALTDGLAIFRE